jgi:hypothetical protein
VAFSGAGYAATPFTNDLETLREASRSLAAVDLDRLRA